LVATDTTDADGEYLFSGLAPGDYYLEFTTPQGYNFTQYNVDGNNQDAADSDPLVPVVGVAVTDGDVEGEFDENVTYTITYSNTDATRQATHIVITTTVPVGTSFVADESTPGWSCTDANEGGICTFTIPTLNANTSGTLDFVVKLKSTDPEVPDPLDLVVHLTHNTLPRTQVVTLVAGQENRTVDAGLVRTQANEQTPTPTAPTNLPETEQPHQQQSIFLPSVQSTQ
jgi:uncharacterized repeat protein (TIGR01451 family)